MKVSIIIPTFNEAQGIGKLISFLNECIERKPAEIIVVDGGSQDNTAEIVKELGVKVIFSPQKGRAWQMNHGAMQASGDILYFLHADSFPLPNFIQKIEASIQNGNEAGCFWLKFDLDHWFLNLNTWFTRFDINAFRYGDQSLFITKDAFSKCGGYDESLVLGEDIDIVKRVKTFAKFRILPEEITTSARKYRSNGVFRLQFIYYYMFLLLRIGVPQLRLVSIYKRLIKQDKI